MKKLFTLIAALISLSAFAQQEGMYTQFMFNKLALNPAYTGSRDATSITALYRHQWEGVVGAPKTVSFNVHSPLRNRRVALGLQATNDRIGLTNTTGIFATYAYRLPVGEGHFSFGLQGGAHFYKMSLTDALSFDPSDGSLVSNFQKWLPNAGAGLYYQSSTFFAGVSAPYLLENSLAPVNMSSGKALQRRHYFGMAGYIFKLSESGAVKFRPSVLVKFVEESPLQADLNGSFLLMEKLWIGASYRTDASIDFNVEWNITDQFRMGYAYDFVLGELGMHTSGSHELLLGFDLDFNYDKILTPRSITPRYF